MNRKILGIAIILLGGAAIVMIVWFLFFRAPKSEPVVINSQDNISEEEQIPNKNLPPIQQEEEQVADKQAIPERKTGEIELAQMAASFAERFGSYSNQSNFGNITDLKIFMSPKMKDWADDYVEDARKRSNISLVYYGITTKSATEDVVFFDDDLGRAEVLVQTSRREAIGTTNNASNFYQDIKIDFIKVNGVWKVDAAYWQDKK